MYQEGFQVLEIPEMNVDRFLPSFTGARARG